MNERQGTFTTFDGIKLFYRYYESSPEADLVVILHGHGEHSGRYEKLVRSLEDENVHVGLYDFRGNGRSEGPEVYAESFDVYLKDVKSFLEHLRSKHSFSGRYILFGHSMGALTALDWACRHPDGIRGMILSSPCLGLRLPSFLRKLNEGLNAVVPRWVFQNPVYPPYLTHNAEEIRKYREDPWIRRKMTVRLLHEMLCTMRDLELVPEFRFTFPVYVLMAGLEKVVDSRATRRFFEKVRAPGKRLKIFSDFYHEIFNEKDQKLAFDELKNCIEEIRRISPTLGSR